MRISVLGEDPSTAQPVGAPTYVVGATVYDGNSKPYKKLPVQAIFQQTGVVLDPVRITGDDGRVSYDLPVPANIVLQPVAPEGFASTPQNNSVKAKLKAEFKWGTDQLDFIIGKAPDKIPWVPIAIGAGVLLIGYFYYRGK